MKILNRIPSDKFYVACSGGVDSMVLVDFLRKYPKNNFDIIYFNHGTKHGQEAQEFLEMFCSKNKLNLHIGKIYKEKSKKESLEEYWRNQRYEFFDSFDGQILTAHHLNDCVETWIHSSLNGIPKLIPYKRGKYIRPLLAVSKKEILNWKERHDVKFIQDESNFESVHTRNFIRNELIPSIKKIQPGIETVIKKMVIKEFLEK